MHLNHTKEENVYQSAIYNLTFPKSQWKRPFTSKRWYKVYVKVIFTRITTIFQVKAKISPLKWEMKRSLTWKPQARCDVVAGSMGQKAEGLRSGSQLCHNSLCPFSGMDQSFLKHGRVLKTIKINFSDRQGMQLLLTEHLVQAEPNARYFLHTISLQ